jgi:signal peptidase II
VNENFFRQNIWLIVAILGFGLDQIIKNMMVVGLWGESAITSWLKFHVVFNRGIAFSLGEGYGLMISAAAFLIFLYFIFTNIAWWQKIVWTQLGVGMVLAGAVSNLIDRLRYGGGVVDYIDVSFYTVFNLADGLIFIGLVLLVWYYWKYSDVD